MRRDGCHGLQVLTALQFAPPLAVRGRWHADVHHIVSWGLVMGRPLCNLFLRDDAVDFCFWKDGTETDQPFSPKILCCFGCNDTDTVILTPRGEKRGRDIDTSVTILHKTDQKNFPQLEEVTQVKFTSLVTKKRAFFLQLQIFSPC